MYFPSSVVGKLRNMKSLVYMNEWGRGFGLVLDKDLPSFIKVKHVENQLVLKDKSLNWKTSFVLIVKKAVNGSR